MEQPPKHLNSPVTTKIMKYMARGQVKIFKLTGGRVGSNWRMGAGRRKPVPTLLLEHLGRKSGRRFTTPLLYLRDGDDLVIVGSQGGLPKHPQWFFNLTSHPEARVHLKGRPDQPVSARVATPAERAALWPRLVDLYADFASYQAWTDREIPVVILTPSAQPGSLGVSEGE